MNVIIIANGDIQIVSSLEQKCSEADYIICADGGIRHMKKLSIFPDLIVGDFDSAIKDELDYYINAGVKTQHYRSDKDRTDTQIAVDEAIKIGAKSIVLLGALGNRFDHSYANVMLLIKLMKLGISAKILNGSNEISVTDDMIILNGEVGQVVSLLPFGSPVWISQTHGLQYPLTEQELPIDNPFGVSNVFTLSEAYIKVSSGVLMIVKAND